MYPNNYCDSNNDQYKESQNYSSNGYPIENHDQINKYAKTDRYFKLKRYLANTFNSIKSSKFSQVDAFDTKTIEYESTILANIDSKIDEFKKKFKPDEYNIFFLYSSNYEELPEENDFLIFKRRSILSRSIIISDKHKSIARTKSMPASENSNDDISNSTNSIPFDLIKKKEYDEKEAKLKQIYLSHLYRKIPNDFNQDYYIRLVTCYMKEHSKSLSQFHGLGIAKLDNCFLPIAMTERPVNGPLSSLFTTVNSNKSRKLRFNIDDTDDKGQNNSPGTYNIEELDTVTAEQKFSMIIGIIYGVAFIHKNNFIHSNLNPTTVYLNEHLQPQLCDYIFIPPFKVETVQNEEKNSNDEKAPKFEYTISGEESRELFKDNVYVSPEILRGGKFDRSIDIYSVGQIIYFILFEEDRQQTNKDESNVNSNSKSKCISTIWDELIRSCIQEDASQRPSAEDLLNILLDEEKMPQFISSITPNASPTPTISEKTNLTLTIYKMKSKKCFNTSPIFDIFHRMIPNINDIDENTRLIISAAENGHIESIEKVGDFFFEGTNNFHRDEGWSYSCYKEAADRGSLYSMKKVAQFKEEGIGTDVDLNDSYDYYSKALKKISSEDPERSKIETKMIELDKIRNTVLLKKVPNDKSISVKNLFNKLKPTIIKTESNGRFQTLKINFNSKNDLQDAREIVRKNRRKFKFEDDFLGIKSVKSHRLDSLDKDLKIIELDRFYPGKDIKTPELLGEGAFAKTYLVYDKETEEPIAAKVFTEELEEDMINSFKREIIMASKFKNHPAIVQYIGFNEFSLIEFFNKKTKKEMKPTIFMKYISGGNLDQAISKGSTEWNDTKKLIVIIGLASGLSEMYNKQIIHRDLKPENILLTEDFEPVICDLGLSRQYSEKNNYSMTTIVGTKPFMPPELFNPDLNPKYKCEVDSYTFGIIMYQVLTLTKTDELYPNTNDFKIMKEKFKDEIPQKLDNLNDVFKEIIASCWNVCADRRPKPPEIYERLVKEVKEQGRNLLPNLNMELVNKYLDKITAK